MKPRRIFTQITLCAALAGLVVWPAWADWGPPLGNGANAHPVEGGYAPPMMPSGNSDMGCADAYGYGPPPMKYLPMDGGAYAGGPCDPNLMGSGGCGQGLGGLASGCRPVGLLGRLGSMTGLAGCGTGGGGGGAGAGAGSKAIETVTAGEPIPYLSSRTSKSSIRTRAFPESTPWANTSTWAMSAVALTGTT